MADKIANYFVPIVVGIAVLTFIVWITLVSPGEFELRSDSVVGATINLNGLIEVKVTKREEDSVLASIIKAVEDAQGTKAPIQRMADKIANYFVPIVVGIAVLTFIVWITLVSPGEFEL